jgi:hypothetical protein
MVTYWVLLLAGQLIGLYDTPEKCNHALVAERAVQLRATPAPAPPPKLKCELRKIQ